MIIRSCTPDMWWTFVVVPIHFPFLQHLGVSDQFSFENFLTLVSVQFIQGGLIPAPGLRGGCVTLRLIKVQQYPGH